MGGAGRPAPSGSASDTPPTRDVREAAAGSGGGGGETPRNTGQQFCVYELVVDRIVGPGEVIGDQDELLRSLPLDGRPQGLGMLHPSTNQLDKDQAEKKRLTTQFICKRLQK